MAVSTSALVMAVVTAVVVVVSALRSARSRELNGRADSADSPAVVRVAAADIRRATITGIGAFLGLQFVGQFVLGYDGFGAIHLAYLELVVTLPLAVMAIVALVAVTGRLPNRGTVRLTRPVTVMAGVLVLLAPLGFYMTHIEPYALQVETIDSIAVASDRVGSMPIRIGVLTDFQVNHVGDYEIRAIDRLLDQHPDVILLPGDIFQDDEESFRRELPALKEQFNRLQAPGGAFLVDGDTDPPRHLSELVEGTPVRFLNNEITQTRVRDRLVTIAGTELDYSTAKSVAVAEELEKAPGVDDIRILLAHRPDAVYNLPAGRSRTDLVVSGHTHGGQIAVPFFGPLMTLTDVPRSVAAGGFSTMEGRRIYVGKGVGLERNQAPQMRFGVPPNIGLLILR